MKKKSLCILGSTGSIGTSALKVVRRFPQHFKVTALSAKSNIDLLEQQAKEFSPQVIAVSDKKAAKILQKRLSKIPVLAGEEGLKEVATLSQVDFVLSAISGYSALLPTLSAIEAGKTIGLANKELLVAAGELVMRKVREKKVALLPIDSEHSALFQCLKNEEIKKVRRFVLTASGGPFWKTPLETLERATPEQALAHLTYKMGKKISIDSSTLMNKGLEVIEAFWLFSLSLEKIEVVIHPQSIIHSFVEYIDGSLLAQLSKPDMELPIQYALFYPERQKGKESFFSFLQPFTLEFFPPDYKKFPCLSLAFEALRVGKSMPCYLNAANEVLVQRFLQKEISWKEISIKLEKLLSSHRVENMLSLEGVFSVDAQGRREAKEA